MVIVLKIWIYFRIVLALRNSFPLLSQHGQKKLMKNVKNVEIIEALSVDCFKMSAKNWSLSHDGVVIDLASLILSYQNLGRLEPHPPKIVLHCNKDYHKLSIIHGWKEKYVWNYILYALSRLHARYSLLRYANLTSFSRSPKAPL